MDSPLIPGLPDEVARECLIRVPYSHFNTIRSVSKLWLDEVESTDFHRLRKTSGLTHPLIAITQSEPVSLPPGPARKYSYTPVYRLVLFEPDTGSWCALPFPPALSSNGLPLFCQVAGGNRELVVIGGWNPETWVASDEVFIYDFLTAKWRVGAKLPGPKRSFFACAASDRDRTVFVAGGHDEDKNGLKSALAYDIARDEWAPLPDMARERDECKGLFHGGKFHVVGGYSTNMQGRFGSCAEAFDADARRWGPPAEDVLEAGTCPRTCVVGSDRKMYRCRAGKLAVAEEGEGKGWRDVSEIPMDARVAPHTVAWRGEVVVIGSARHDGPHSGYVLERVAEGRGHSHGWKKLKVLDEFSGPVQTMCCLEV